MGSEASLRAKEKAENFPVALRVLPRRYRVPLGAVYDVVRSIDDLGDEASGDRTALLKGFAADLGRVWRDGNPQAAVLRRLVPVARECPLAQEPFDRLVAANLQDQRVAEYATYDELRRYCTLSADPVGRLVLAVFAVTQDPVGQNSGVTLSTVELSDRVCTALQLIEHWQDVGEDRGRGRVYLPGEDLAAFGVALSDLDAATASPALRRLMLFEIDRAAALLESGMPLIGRLHGWARVAVAGYVAGGQAALAALRRSEGDVLGRPVKPRKLDVLRYLLVHLLRPPAGSGRRQTPGAEQPQRVKGTAAC